MLTVWIIVKKTLGNSVNILNLYFDIHRIVIANSIFPFPKISLERILVFSWVLTCFLINIFLQTKITSFLAIKKYYPEINTIEELFSSGLPLYSIPNQIVEVKKKYNGTKYEAYADSLISISSNEGLMDQMIYRADVDEMPAFLTEHDIAVFISRCKNFRKNGAQVYHLVKESIIPNFQSYKVIHNSPLLPILNKKLRRLEEAGFIGLWAKKTIFNATVEGFLFPEGCDDGRSARPLSLDVTAIWFLILVIGYSLATTVFVVEIMVDKINQRKRRIIFIN